MEADLHSRDEIVSESEVDLSVDEVEAGLDPAQLFGLLL